MLNRLVLWAILPAAVSLAAAPPAAAEVPDAKGAAIALVRTPLRVAGDLTGGLTQLGATGVALLGDAVSLVDANRVTKPLLRGGLSRTIGAAAFAVAWTGSQTLQLLRFEDVERLPEPPAAFIGSARSAGRLDSTLGGLATLTLGLRDALLGTSEVLLRASGASDAADRVAHHLYEARVRTLGPDPLPTGVLTRR